jgi:hypothetical protein
MGEVRREVCIQREIVEDGPYGAVPADFSEEAKLF